MEILDPKRSGSKTKLGLELPTDPRWAHVASMEIEEILIDHAYCEQKAASSCISLIQQYPDKIELVNEVAPVVTEEWGHFRLVLAEIQKRGLHLGKQRKDEYVNKLLSFNKKSGNREERLIENLLTCALIEARSCERFRILSLEIKDEQLKDFYHHFMVSEAGHYKMFLRLAKHYGGDGKVSQRWQEYLDFEAEMVKGLPLRGDRMH